jgi:hypothetical protein
MDKLGNKYYYSLSRDDMEHSNEKCLQFHMTEQTDENIDEAIEECIKQLRATDTAALPEDYETLMQLYLRLQFRKIHRINAILFEHCDANKMAERVLGQLREEVEVRQSML